MPACIHRMGRSKETGRKTDKHNKNRERMNRAVHIISCFGHKRRTYFNMSFSSTRFIQFLFSISLSFSLPPPFQYYEYGVCNLSVRTHVYSIIFRKFLLFRFLPFEQKLEFFPQKNVYRIV